MVLLLAGGGLVAAAVAYLWQPDRDRAALEATYARSPADFIQVAGLRVHVRDTGPRDGPVLMLLHGFGASLQTWEPWSIALSDRFRVIRFDLPGFGLTGADPSGDYSDVRGVTVLAALMDKLGVAWATLIGNSLGGKLAWMFAAAHPDRVERLVLVSPDGFASPGFAYGKPAEVPSAMAILPYVLPTPMVRMTLAPAYADPSVLSDATVASYRDMMLAPGVRRAMVARMRQVILSPPEPALRTIAAPTLLLWGEADAMIPFSNARDYLRTMPNARLVSLPGVGHVPMEEAPTRSLAPVRAFLDGG